MKRNEDQLRKEEPSDNVKLGPPSESAARIPHNALSPATSIVIKYKKKQVHANRRIRGVPNLQSYFDH